MENENDPSLGGGSPPQALSSRKPVARSKFQKIAGWLVLLVVVQFFGCGLVMIFNLYKPILPEGTIAIISLIVFAELLILFVVGKSIQVITRMRKMR